MVSGRDNDLDKEYSLVVGKLWNSFHEKEHVKPIFQQTLDNYSLEYIDLYLIHFPMATPKKEFNLVKAPLQDTWRELEDLVDAGLIRNIGISNFNVQSTLDLLTYARIPPSVLEIEHHPYLQQRRLVNWAQLQDIKTFGKLDEASSNCKHCYKTQVNVGQVLLAWAVNYDVIVIPKTVKIERMKTNLDIHNIKLDDQDLKSIPKLEANARFNDFFENTYGFDFPVFA
ncbi:hypothetical protein [Parasitella parasitica]|uniref:NADP-dependent oxidoreductase domain-containing protein n=1 Tax=Parasitella parasitica TaxID=35722 RepID=A0A0B7NWP3_9FUNG|nr:hypothetical protein [Parasitella parasitica]